MAAHPAALTGAARHLVVPDYVLPVYRDAVPPAQVGRQLCRGAVHLRSEPLGVVYEAFVLDAYRDAVDRPVASMPGDVDVAHALGYLAVVRTDDVVGGGIRGGVLEPVYCRGPRALGHVDHYLVYLRRSAVGRRVVRPVCGIPDNGRFTGHQGAPILSVKFLTSRDRRSRDRRSPDLSFSSGTPLSRASKTC